MKTLTIMSYNIKNGRDEAGENCWSNRRAALCALISARDPDILCCQEVFDVQLDYMLESLPQYGHSGVGRDDGAREGEFSPVFYKKDRFGLVSEKTAWLSPTPDIPSKGWDAHHNRICSLAVLEDKVFGGMVTAASLHLDHAGEEARRNGAAVARRFASAESKGQAFLAGDYNFGVGSLPYAVMTNDPFSDARLAAAEHTDFGSSHHGFKNVDLRMGGSPIDHIFFTPGEYKPVRAEVLPVKFNGIYPSDHFPLLICFVAR